ncbi:unnamed protein product [Closterium sp. NIES-54]
MRCPAARLKSRAPCAAPRAARAATCTPHARGLRTPLSQPSRPSRAPCALRAAPHAPTHCQLLRALLLLRECTPGPCALPLLPRTPLLCTSARAAAATVLLRCYCWPMHAHPLLQLPLALLLLSAAAAAENASATSVPAAAAELLLPHALLLLLLPSAAGAERAAAASVPASAPEMVLPHVLLLLSAATAKCWCCCCCYLLLLLMSAATTTKHTTAVATRAAALCPAEPGCPACVASPCRAALSCPSRAAVPLLSRTAVLLLLLLWLHSHFLVSTLRVARLPLTFGLMTSSCSCRARLGMAFHCSHIPTDLSQPHLTQRQQIIRSGSFVTLLPALQSATTFLSLNERILASRKQRRLSMTMDQFLAIDPTELTLDSLEKSLLETKKITVAVAASRGTPRPPFFEGCAPSPFLPSIAIAAAVDLVGAASAPSGRRNNIKGKGGKGGGGGTSGGGGGGGGGKGGGGGGGSGGEDSGDGPGGGGGRSGGGGWGGGGSRGGGGGRGGAGKGRGRGASARGGGGFGSGQQLPRLLDNPTPQQLREWVVQRGSSGGSGRCPYIRHTGKLKGQTCGKPHTEYRCFDRLEDAWVDEYGDELPAPNWLKLQGMGVDVYAIDFVKINAAIYAMYATELSDEDACYSCVPSDARVVATALGASESAAALGASASAVTGASASAASAEALHTFKLDSGTSRSFFRDCTTLTPLAAPIPVSLADPSGGPVVARASTVLPCPAVPSGSLSGLHLPSFSRNLVSNAALQDVWVDTFTLGGQRVAICTCSRTGRHLASFTRRPRSSLYTLTTASAQVAESGQVAASSPVSASGQLAASCSCRVLSH